MSCRLSLVTTLKILGQSSQFSLIKYHYSHYLHHLFLIDQLRALHSKPPELAEQINEVKQTKLAVIKRADFAATASAYFY